MYDISNPIQGFLYNSSSDAAIFLEPSPPAQDGLGGSYVSPLYNISMQDFGSSLGQLINAWIQGSFYNSTLITTRSPFSTLFQTVVTGNAASFVPSSDKDLSALIQNQTAAFTVLTNSTSNMQLYACDFAWTGVFFLATTSMLFAAILGVVFNRMTVVPDYLGYVSSLAKESQYVRIPDGGANLDDMERARLIKELRVR